MFNDNRGYVSVCPQFHELRTVPIETGVDLCDRLGHMGIDGDSTGFGIASLDENGPGSRLLIRDRKLPVLDP